MGTKLLTESGLTHMLRQQGYCELVIGPEVAEVILRDHNASNRKVKRGTVERYAREMKSGHWLLDPNSPITFGTSGNIISGQHRLHAIVKAKTAVPFIVWFNVSEETKRVADTHAPRTLHDTLWLTGMQIDRRVTDIARFMLEIQQGYVKPSNQEMQEFMEVYGPAAMWAHEKFPKRLRGVSQACVASAIGTAYYSVPDNILERFCSILTDGIYEEEHAITVVNLRNLLLREGGVNSGQKRRRAYRITQRCIKAYVDHERLTKIYTPEYDAYTLPAIEELTPAPKEMALDTAMATI